MLEHLRECRGVLVPHQDRNRESVDASLQGMCRPRVPNGVERILRASFRSSFVGERPSGLMPQFRSCLFDSRSLQWFQLRNESFNCLLVYGVLPALVLEVSLLKALPPHFDLQLRECAIYSIGCPGVPGGVAEERTAFVLEHQSLRNREGFVGQKTTRRTPPFPSLNTHLWCARSTCLASTMRDSCGRQPVSHVTVTRSQNAALLNARMASYSSCPMTVSRFPPGGFSSIHSYTWKGRSCEVDSWWGMDWEKSCRRNLYHSKVSRERFFLHQSR